MTARRVYEADRAVIEECARRGAPDITARKLERWRRYLPDRIVEHPAGLRGSSTANPPRYVDQVLALDALIKAGMPLREAPMRLFDLGFSVKVEDLREVYAGLYAQVRYGLTKNSARNIDAEPADRADELALLHAAGIRRGAAGRRWAKRARKLVTRGGAFQGDDPDALFVSALSVMFTWMVAGEHPSAEGVIEALSVVGLNDGQDPAAAAIQLAGINLDAISDAIDAAAEDDWLAARQDVELMVRYIELRRSVDQLWTPEAPVLEGLGDVGLGNADMRSVLIPVALVLDEMWRKTVLHHCQQYAAAARLLNDTPTKFRPFLRPDLANQLQSQSEAFRVELNAFLTTWALAHPDDVRMFQRAET